MIEEWDNILLETIQKLHDSIPRRNEAILMANILLINKYGIYFLGFHIILSIRCTYINVIESSDFYMTPSELNLIISILL